MPPRAGAPRRRGRSRAARRRRCRPRRRAAPRPSSPAPSAARASPSSSSAAAGPLLGTPRASGIWCRARTPPPRASIDAALALVPVDLPEHEVASRRGALRAGRGPPSRHRQSCRNAARRGGTGRRGSACSWFPSLHRPKRGRSKGARGELLERCRHVGERVTCPEQAAGADPFLAGARRRCTSLAAAALASSPSSVQDDAAERARPQAELVGRARSNAHREVAPGDRLLHLRDAVVPVGQELPRRRSCARAPRRGGAG